MKEAFSTAMGAITTEYYGKKYVDNGGNSSTTLLSVMTGDTTSGLKYELEKAGYTCEISSNTYTIKEYSNGTAKDKPYLIAEMTFTDDKPTVKFAKEINKSSADAGWEGAE